MIVVLTGAPGAGKGTQANLLSERLGYATLSTGAALRSQVKAGTEIGKIAGAIMDRGDLVPDDVLFKIVKAELGEPSDKVFLLDGYPRNLAQAETLDGLKDSHPVKAAIELAVPREELIKRLSGRRVCSECGTNYHIDMGPPKKEGVCDKCGGSVIQRKDDNPDSVAVRLDVFEKNTKPILGYYEKQGLHMKVDGTGTSEEIFQRLKVVIEDLQGN
jgi:adenylate kinase